MESPPTHTAITPPESDTQGPTVRPAGERTLLWLETLLAIGAIAGAIGVLFSDLLGDATERLPFGSAAFAGVALALVNGLFPLVVVIGARRQKGWARLGHVLVGIGLMGWIVVQVYFLGPPVHWLQALYFVWGLTISVLGLRLLPGGDRREL